MRILVVEDEGLIALMLALEIESGGHTVMGPVATVAEALELAAQCQPDLALLDVNLGEGHCDGIEAARLLLERHGCRALFISGDVASRRAHAVNAWGMLRKPYDPKMVMQSVRLIEAIREGREPEHRLRALLQPRRRSAASPPSSVAETSS